MMRLARLGFALSLLLIVPSIRAQETTKEKPKTDAVIEAIFKEGKSNSKVMEHLDHLTNKIGPRLTSSDRLTKAQEWARDQFRSFGIDNARLEPWGTFPVGFNRGPWSGKMTAPEEKDLVCATMAWTAGTNGPIEGPAVLAPTNDEDLAAKKDKLKGAWVVSTGRGQDKYWVAYEEAGVAGVVRTQGGELIITDGQSRISWDKLPKRVTVYLTGSEHKEIVELLKGGKEVKLKFDIKNEFKKGPIELYNVVADIVGTEKPHEYVIVGGHIDSWDGATGATDNGTGTCTTIEAARLLMKAGAKPRRTIRFMLWSGEEQGLLGSRGYIQKHPDELPNISAVLVHDGGTNYVSGINATKPMVPIFEKVFAPVMDFDGELKFKIREVPALPLGIGSDHDSFLQRGVPGFFWGQAGTKEKRQNYTHEHHTQYDTYSAAIPEFQQHTSMVVAVGALGIANLDSLLPREGLTNRGGGGGGGRSGRRLGITTEETAEGLKIASVTEGSVAAGSGLKEGDIIVKIDDTAVKTQGELREAVLKTKENATVTVKRAGKETVIKVKFPGGGGGDQPQERRMLGVNLDGTTILSIVEGSAAEKAGLQEGDEILKLGEKAVTTQEELVAAIQSAKKETTVSIRRNGKEMTLPVTFSQ